MSTLVDERRISGKAFAGSYAAAVGAGLGLAILCFLIPGGALFSPIGVLPVAGVAVWAWLNRAGSTYRLFDDRLEIESGLLGRKIENVELFRVRDVGLRQGLLGRLGDYGDVYVHSTDSSTPDLHLRGIDSPRAFYQLLRERVGDSRAQNRTLFVEEGRPLPEP